ncbi:MAG: P-loop NTPase, partial [Bacteroidota bacterium]
VENMSWFTPAELPDNKYYLFGKGGGTQLAGLSESTLLGQIPIVQSIREAGDEGQPIVIRGDSPSKTAFLELARNTILQVNKRNESQAPTQTVNVKL